MTKVQKAFCVFLCLCFFAVLAVLPGPFSMRETVHNVYRQFPFYYFTEEKVTAAIEQLKALRDQELEANIEEKKSQDPTYSMSLENIDQNIEVIYDFVQQRSDMIRQQMQELYGIYMK